MGYLFPTYARKPFELISGVGTRVTDQTGKEYLDFTSGIGVVNLGYNNPILNQALQEQSERIWHTANIYENHLQEEVAEKLVDGKDYLAYFCNSGAEANEAALKLARKATGKSKIISFQNSFHGRTYGAMSATGQDSIQQGFAPLAPDFVFVPYNELAPLEAALDGNTAAVIMELIQGEGGVLPADYDWVQQVAKQCKQNNTLLIVDEIQTGMGRTGSFYAFEQYDIEPDIFTLAKGLGNGIPVGAMLGKSELAKAFGAGSHGSTFGGNKLAMAVASKVCDAIKEEKLMANVKARSEELFAAFLDAGIEVRGKGLMIGLPLKDQAAVKTAMAELEAEGLLTLKAGTNVLRLLPPLIITQAEVSEAVAKLKKILLSTGVK